MNIWFDGETVSNLQSTLIRFCSHQEYIFNKLAKVCITPDRRLHISGKRQLTGITMTPAMEGEWRWESDYSLRFTPAQPWPAGKDYHVEFQPSVFPSQVTLHDTSFNIHSASLRASVSTIEFFQDHNEAENRGVSTSINFNMPVTTETLKRHLFFKMEELTEAEKPEDRKIISTIESLPFDIKMDDDGLSANITTPIATMPDKERFVVAALSKGMVAISGGEPLGEPDLSRTYDLERRQGRIRIPSVYDYAEIQSIQASIIQNDHYVPEQTLIIEGNVPVTGDELEQHLKIYQLPKDKAPAFKDGKPDRDYSWTSASEVTDAYTVQPFFVDTVSIDSRISLSVPEKIRAAVF